ncbi:MAG: arylsulfatase [Chthoniobacter sp.]|uniref:arylsulfatase n=1 Tax=Chthoniobacter sp. TaxID=2510640 RepID=UPI0032ACEBCE
MASLAILRRPAVFALALLAAAATAWAAAPSKPNILIILADDMGFSDAGCYGGEVATPNLDALAKGGLRFTQFYNTARCWPSRGALLTGYYAQEIRRDTVPGVISGGRGIRPGWAKLLPEMLKQLGYRTYHSGKWHVDGKPLQNGFDHSYDIEDHNHNFNPQNLFEDDQKLPPVKPDSGYYTTTAYADHAIKCLQEHAAKYSDQPFFEYLAFTCPHFPLQARPEDIAKYRDRFRKGWDVLRQERWQRLSSMGIVDCALSPIERSVGPPYAFPKDVALLGPGEIDRPVPWADLTDVQRDFQATKMAIHAAMVDRMDQEIGRVLAQIKAMGAYENTIVLFLSDNGASAEMMVRGDGHDPSAPPGSAKTFLCLGPGFSSLANTPFRRHKTWTHEGGIATPLIVEWPKGIAARGELRHTPGHLVDVVPTLLDIVGGKRLDTWEGQPTPTPPGRSLAAALAKDITIPHPSIWWQHEGNRALRVGDWKIVAAGEKSPWELYDLSKDRGEQNDLASTQPERLKDMAAQWEKQTEEYRALALKDATPEMKSKAGKGKKEAD